MLLKSLKRSTFTGWLLGPVITGLLMTGAPPVAKAQVFQPPPQQENVVIGRTDQAKVRMMGLDSLGNMMRSSTIGQPLVLNPQFKVPLPGNLSAFVKDRKAALQLGKALFWDMQLGSDGIQSCATCHFQSGSDVRTKNMSATQGNRVLEKRGLNASGNVDEALKDVLGYYFAPADADTAWEAAFLPWTPNYPLTGADFPLALTQNAYLKAGDTINADIAAGNRNDVVGSSGVMPAKFAGVTPGSPVDNFVAGTEGTNRLITGRNAPPSVNAIFNYLQFWDGRADSKFNGFNPLGRHDTSKPKYFVNKASKLMAKALQMELASLASQATGPPLSDGEMSYLGRTWPDIGKKLTGDGLMRPLAYQKVDPNDSVLGTIVHSSGKGLNTTYKAMVQAAFKDELWDFPDTKRVKFPNSKLVRGPEEMNYIQGAYRVVTKGNAASLPGEYTQMEANFSLFFGIAVMLYEAELVSEQTKFDKWMDGDNNALTDEELAGLNVYVNEGKCIACHGTPALTNASVQGTQAGQENIEPIRRRDGTPVFYTNGFYNVGMEPTVDDLQHGAPDPFGKPWGSARQFLFQKFGVMKIPFTIDGLPIRNLTVKNQVIDPVSGKVTYQELWKDLLALDNVTVIDSILVCVDKNLNGVCDLSDDIKIKAVDQDGSCKASSLRNVELNGPYFHNGGAATLQQVLDNYDVGGKFSRDPLNKVDMLPDITELNLEGASLPFSFDHNGVSPSKPEQALVSFLLALTDERVKKEIKPFDHPQLFVPVDGTAPRLKVDEPDLNAWLANNASFKEDEATGALGGDEAKCFHEHLNPALTHYHADTGKGPFQENQ
jgi:cytochrome c peroxidase